MQSNQLRRMLDSIRAILRFAVPTLLMVTAAARASGLPQEDKPASNGNLMPTKLEANKVAPEISFAFDRTPWRDVIRWLADNCNLALHYEELPTGSFTYADRQAFSEAEAIDRVNLFLLPQGFTLVRSGSLLSVINLGDPRSDRQLDALAQLATANQLTSLPDHTVVKCLFALKELEPEDAVRELAVLNLMKPPAVLSKTRQLLIIDTVGKLRSVKSILDSFEPKTLGNGTIMKSFALEHVAAEDILVVARPHLGLATDEMIGIDVSLSADLQGKHIFVTGVEDRVTLIENLVQALDQPAEELTADGSGAVLQSHTVRGGNSEQIYNVLQTLLAGKSLRLSVDEDSDTIVALAAPDIQSEIEQTIAKMEAAQSEFEVIPLSNIDPYFAITLLEQMLDLPDPFDDEDENEGPKIDADPGNMRLFVRGKRHEIDQIKTIVEGLDSGEAKEGSTLRIIPALGDKGKSLLRTAARLWSGENAILLVGDETPKEDTERVVAPNPPENTKLVAVSTNRLAERYLNAEFDASLPTIRCLFSQRGLLLECEDVKALDEFEAHFRAISGPLDSQPSPPIVFYLKFTKAAEAITMLAELLDGGESAREGAAGTLVNGYVSSGSFLGSIVTARDGTITMTSGSITVVADPRLNRLIAQGSSSDIEQIESYLKIIDKSNSITDVEVYGKSHVIEVKNSIASEVAQVLREAYAHHLAGGNAGSSGRPSGQPAQPQQRPNEQEDRKSSKETKNAPRKPTGSAAAVVMEPKMTIAVHEPSNSLIVTAPEQLLAQVKDLVAQIDQRSEQTMEVVSTSGTALQAILAPDSIRGSRSSSPNSSRSRTPSSSSRSSVQDLLRSRFGK